MLRGVQPHGCQRSQLSGMRRISSIHGLLRTASRQYHAVPMPDVHRQVPQRAGACTSSIRRATTAVSQASGVNPVDRLLKGIEFEQTRNCPNFKGEREYFSEFQVRTLEEMSMAGGPFTQSELHAMLTWARRYQELPAHERFAALDDIRRTLQGATRRSVQAAAAAPAARQWQPEWPPARRPVQPPQPQQNQRWQPSPLDPRRQQQQQSAPPTAAQSAGVQGSPATAQHGAFKRDAGLQGSSSPDAAAAAAAGAAQPGHPVNGTGHQPATADQVAAALHDRRMSHGKASSSGSAPAMVQTSRNGSRANVSGSRRTSADVKYDSPLPPEVLQRLQDKPPRLVYFDLETTGRGGQAQRIVEVAAKEHSSGAIFESLVNIFPMEMPQNVFEIHGISTAMVHDPAVKDFSGVGQDFIDFIMASTAGGTPILMAHNGKGFDVPILTRELKRCNLELPGDWLWADSLKFAQKQWRGKASDGNGLQSLRAHFGLQQRRAHRAMADVEVLSEVFVRLVMEETGEDVFREETLVGLFTQQWAGSITDIAAGKKRRKSGKHTPPPLPADVFHNPHSRHAQALLPADDDEEDEELADDIESDLEDDEINDTSEPSDALPPAAGASEAAAQVQALVVDAATEGEEELQAQLAADPTLPAAWAALLADEAEGRGVLDLPLAWVQPDLRRHMKREANRLAKLWEKLPEAGIRTLWELLQYYPRDYQNFEAGAWRDEAHVMAAGHVDARQAFGGCFKATLHVSSSPPSMRHQNGSSGDEDEEWEVPPDELPGASGPTQVVDFMKYGSSWAANSLVKAFPVGRRVAMRGRLSPARNGRWTVKADSDLIPLEDYTAQLAAGCEVIPVYAASKPLKAEDFPAVITEAMRLLDADPEAGQDPIPTSIISDFGLVQWREALRAVHYPASMVVAEAGRRRLAFDELFLLQLKLLLKRALQRAPRDEEDAKGSCCADTVMVEAARAALPFELTRAQDRTLAQILGDMAKPFPMNRLLQGDVGSGKTAVAFLALMAAAGSGMQGALMAPTEILASQHCERLEELLRQLPRRADGRRISVALLTGSVKGKQRRGILAELASGELSLVVGTHALLSEPVHFANLGLAVVDEQHRFGVAQRAKLQNKNTPAPHVLAMTATPIPRTLSLVSYGDMALSVINELPPGRSPIDTRVLIDQAGPRQEMYERIRTELEAGGRAYIICPLVEASKSATLEDVKAAEDEHARLVAEGQLGGAKIGLLHGRLAPEEKIAALDAFSSGRTPVLISTTVVEVGVDVVEASVMVVEHAERFGLAQLHQLRGRVGRGARPSSCYLVTTERCALDRLSIMERSQDGFVIAQADLDHRGPGELLGRKQSGQAGLGCLRAARLPGDTPLLEAARSSAKAQLTALGLDPADWPPRLLGALRDRALPPLDLAELPERSLAGHAAANAASE